MSKRAALFDIRPGEEQPVTLLFLQYFCLGAASNFIQAAALPLFLTAFGARALPFTYVVNAAIVPLFTFAYLRAGRRVPIAGLLAGVLGGLALLIAAFRLGLGLAGGPALLFALPVLFQMLITFGNLAVWSLAARLLNAQQGKRLFGLVGAGYWVAVVITGLLIPPLVTWVGTVNLLLLAAVAVAAALALLLSTSRMFARQLALPAPAADVSEPPAATRLFGSRYTVLLFALLICGWVAFYFLDTIFYEQANARYLDIVHLTRFMGLFLAGVGGVTLFSNAFLTGRILGRFGVRSGMLVLPTVLLAATGALALAGRMHGSPALLFWLAGGAKVAAMALGLNLDRSTLTTLYQPLPPAQRSRLQATAEGLFQPLASGLAGVGLLAIGAFYFPGTSARSYAAFMVVFAWLIVAILLGREYPAMLLRALARRQLNDPEPFVRDGSALAILRRHLDSPFPGAVVYALRALEAAGDDSLDAALVRLLDHPAAEVRLDVLERIERLRLSAAVPAIEAHAAGDPVAAVRGAAVRALVALDPRASFYHAVAWVSDPDLDVRRGALAGLLRTGGIEGSLIAGQALLQMVHAARPADRILAAQVLGELALHSFHQPLATLLQDPDPAVQRAALHAVAQSGNARLWPLVVEKLNQAMLCRAAAAALVAGGPPVLPELAAAFDRPGQPPEIQAELAEAAGRIGGSTAVAWLLAHRAHPHPDIRTAVLHGLSRCGYRATGDAAGPIQSQLKAEAAQAAELLAVQVDLGEAPALDLLQAALGAVLAQTRTRVLLLLSYVYDPEAVARARASLTGPSPEQQANALEMLHVLLRHEDKKVVFALLADRPASEQLALLQDTFPQAHLSRTERLRAILAGMTALGNPWPRACALYAAGCLPLPELADDAALLLEAKEPLLREAALGALARLDLDGYQDRLAPLCDDPDARVARLARHVLRAGPAEEQLWSTPERVLALKRASIFAATPDSVLADVALLLQEVPAAAGEPVFAKGEFGDSLYIIAHGAVRVHDGARTLDDLQAGEVFGEMNVLDPGARLSSATAVTAVRLLCLAHDPVHDLIEERPEVARGIIRVLSRRLRSRIQDLNALRARLPAPGEQCEPQRSCEGNEL